MSMKNVNTLKSSIDALATFINIGNFNFSESGVYFKAIDPSQILLVDYSLPKEAFESYLSQQDKTIALDLVELGRVMNRIPIEDALKMNISDSEFKVVSKGTIERNFRMPLLEVSENEISIPKSKFDAKVEINARLFKDILKDASLFASSVILRTKNDQFIVETKGSKGNFKAVCKDNINMKTNDDVVSKYSLDFLKNIIKEADNDKEIIVEFKTDAPIKVTFNISEATLKYHLAHMIM